MRYLGIAGIFQFYKVRLKRFLNTNKKAASIISILQSSIKTVHVRGLLGRGLISILQSSIKTCHQADEGLRCGQISILQSSIKTLPA